MYWRTRQDSFPATPAGGPEYLRSLASPIPAIRFCPTGGITGQAAPEWLRLPNVVCVGGSWMCAPALVRAANWGEVERLSREASALRGQAS